MHTHINDIDGRVFSLSLTLKGELLHTQISVYLWTGSPSVAVGQHLAYTDVPFLPFLGVLCKPCKPFERKDMGQQEMKSFFSRCKAVS